MIYLKGELLSGINYFKNTFKYKLRKAESRKPKADC